MFLFSETFLKNYYDDDINITDQKFIIASSDLIPLYGVQNVTNDCDNINADNNTVGDMKKWRLFFKTPTDFEEYSTNVRVFMSLACNNVINECIRQRYTFAEIERSTTPRYVVITWKIGDEAECKLRVKDDALYTYTDHGAYIFIEKAYHDDTELTYVLFNV